MILFQPWEKLKIACLVSTSEDLIQEWRRVGEEGKVLLLLGKKVVGVEEGVEVDKHVLCFSGCLQLAEAVT